MPAMNISLQRRIGKLPRSPDYLDNIRPTIFENSHAGYGSRVPTPTQKGFFGIGKAHKTQHLGNEHGDGKMTAIYGNDGTRSLPAPGIYGIGSAPGEETIMPSPMDYKPAHWNTPGLFGTVSQHSNILIPIALLGVVLYKLK